MASISLSAAKAHIAKIRHDKGLSETNTVSHNVADLESALTTLSEQLYQSSTHFLLELIQNADDNSYHPNTVPSLHFEYSKSHLRIDCNEVGFSPRNVEALCRVGQSTKKGGDDATRYVGEKGIGFKSVFKAADIVWISSGFYSFKFDKSKPLGMIAPIWDDFPVSVRPGWTSLYLKLTENYNQSGLLNELRSLDSRLLIFLRRLRSVTVSISEPLRMTWKSSFSRAEIGKDLVRLTENKKTCDYIIKRHQVSKMPEEPKRQGVTSSEIILGFPLDENNQPKRESQQAYAFLPIRDYGFEFLIQADFLLIASREDIDESSPWNEALRNALFDAFLDAIQDFNKGKLRYTWPRYLPMRDPLESFLKPFHNQLMNLSFRPVLYSVSGGEQCPWRLTYVPDKFLFNGTPISTSANTSEKYLSRNYSPDDLKFLEKLGVKEMSEVTFFSELRTMFKDPKGDFKNKSDAWHSHLADILIRFGKSYQSQLLDLPLVPLENGTWAAVTGNDIVFPATKAEFELPTGLRLLVVDSKAIKDPMRRKLFTILGVGDLKQGPVVRHIQELHSTGTYMTAISSSALLSQIKFLYTAGWKNPSFERFWLTSESGQRLIGSELYQDSKKPFSATHFFGKHRKKFPFVDQSYLQAPSKGMTYETWTDWLENKMDVATMPRLVQTTAERGYKMSDDFEWIIKNFPSSEVLLLLRDNWEEYGQYFETIAKAPSERLLKNYDPGKLASSAIQLKGKLGSMLVLDTDGTRSRLDSTFLPSKDLMVASQDGVPFLDVIDPDDPRWQNFEILGVKIKVDVDVYLRCLKKLAMEKSNDRERIERLYDTLQFKSEIKSEATTIKNFFLINDVIFIPSSKRYVSQWLRLSQCRWAAPLGKEFLAFKTFTCLKDVYPGHRRLFGFVLDIRDVSLDDLIWEAKSLAVGDSLSYITSIYHSIETAMEQNIESEDRKSRSAVRAFGRCRDLKVFPASRNWNLDTGLVSQLHNSAVSSEWYIADTAPFRTIFAGVVPLFDIQVDDLAPMDQFLHEMGLKTRYLSKLAKSVPRTKGVVVHRQDLTETFRSKVDFIIRLIPTTKQHRAHRQEVIKQLHNLQVYTADEVIQEWSVTYKGSEVKGPPGNGQCALAVKKGVLEIYLAVKSGIEVESMPIELVDEIFNFCGMKADNPPHSEMCLHFALSQSNTARISKVFADKGIPSLEGLKFADSSSGDAGDSKGKGKETEEDEFDFATDSVVHRKSGEGLKKTLKAIGTVPLAIISIPVVIIVGLGDLFKGMKHFDGRDDSPKAMAKSQWPSSAPKKGKGQDSQTGTFQIAMSKSLFRLRHLTCSSALEAKLAFQGELAVHQVLAQTLGQSYNPTTHWLSSNRTQANFSSPPRASNPNFSFRDTTGTFTHLLQTHHHPSAKDWIATPPTYHIDVKSSLGDIHTEFPISEEEFGRAKKWSVMLQQMNSERSSGPRNVYIIARVCDLESVVRKGKADEGDAEAGRMAKIVFLVDPWEYYHADRLVLRHKGKLVASIV